MPGPNRTPNGADAPVTRRRFRPVAPRDHGSALRSRSRATSPSGCGELGGATIPPRLRQDTQRPVPGCVFEAGADVDGPNQVVDEPPVLGLPAGRRVFPPGPASERARIGLSIPLAQELKEAGDPAIRLAQPETRDLKVRACYGNQQKDRQDRDGSAPGPETGHRRECKRRSAFRLRVAAAKVLGLPRSQR